MSSQFVTTSPQKRPKSAVPYAFTENGIAMLSSVLRSPMAIATNIHIMRAFNVMRHFIGSHAQDVLSQMNKTQILPWSKQVKCDVIKAVSCTTVNK